MNHKRILGGVTPYPPLSTRTEERINPHVTQYNPFTLLDPHVRGNWHRVRSTGIPHIAWAIHRIRRQRVGQLPLFGKSH